MGFIATFCEDCEETSRNYKETCGNCEETSYDRDETGRHRSWCIKFCKTKEGSRLRVGKKHGNNNSQSEAGGSEIRLRGTGWHKTPEGRGQTGSTIRRTTNGCRYHRRHGTNQVIGMRPYWLPDNTQIFSDVVSLLLPSNILSRIFC